MEYRRLCTAVGWEAVMNFEVAPAALASSLCAVTAIDEGRAIGMGRIVGDGAIFCYIQDIVVEPARQRQGIGTRLLERLLDYLRGHAPDKAFIGLFVAEGTLAFYERYGFHDYSPSMTGVFLVAPV